MSSQSKQAISWSEEQQAAFEARGRSVLVTAGAGCGKTGVLVEAVVRSILIDRVNPREILAVTFTNKAAAEMKNRIRKRMAQFVLDGEHPGATLPEHDPMVETIDAWCHRLLKAGALEMGLDPEFTLLARGSETSRLEARAMDEAIGLLLESELRSDLLELLAEVPMVRTELISIHARLSASGDGEPGLPQISEEAVRDRLLQSHTELQRAAAAAAEEIRELLDQGENETPTVTEAIGVSEQISVMDLEQVAGFPFKAINRSPKANKGPEVIRFNAARKGLLRSLGEVQMLPHYRTASELFARYAQAATRIRQEEAVLTFADVERLAVELLRREAAAGAKPRFKRVFVDEFQDVNGLQQELVQLLSGDSYFAVGDAAQSIYGFRGSDVALIEQRAEALAGQAGVLSLRTNYRSVAEVLDANNHVHSKLGVTGFSELIAGRNDPAPELPVELHVIAQADEVSNAEAKARENAAIAVRIRELIDSGDVAGPGSVAVLARSRTTLVEVADSLRRLGIPAVIEGGGGLWVRPEVEDLVAVLAVTGNSSDEGRLLKLLRSAICGVSIDGLVLLTHAARKRRVGVWAVLKDPSAVQLSSADTEALAKFVPWLRRQRELAGRRPLAEAVEAAIVETGYDLYLLGLPEGERRFANVRSLQMFANDWEARHGRDPRRFADEVAQLASSGRTDEDQEAVVEEDGEQAGAVRLLTMHGAKGLQFDTVVVPRLGSRHQSDRDRIRVSANGERVLMTGTVDGSSERLFDPELHDEAKLADAAERARLLYVAMTRAERRLILTSQLKLSKEGKVKLSSDGEVSGPTGGASFIAELQPALAPRLAERFDSGELEWVEDLGTKAKVKLVVDRGEALTEVEQREFEAPTGQTQPDFHPQPQLLDPALFAVNPSHFSYSGLQQAAACPLRWYAENAIGMPNAWQGSPAQKLPELSPRVRGVVMHALLETQGFGDPPPSPDQAVAAAGVSQEDLDLRHAPAVVAATSAVLASPTWQRISELGLADPKTVRREESFVLMLDCGIHGQVHLRGVIDVFVKAGAGLVQVIDWKASAGATLVADLPALVEADYAIQREAYALAALQSGGLDRPDQVEVIHLYAERPSEPVTATFNQTDVERLRESLAARVCELLESGFSASQSPHAGLCSGCPAAGTLCPHPPELTEHQRTV